jgi:hypothetical protein
MDEHGAKIFGAVMRGLDPRIHLLS